MYGMMTVAKVDMVDACHDEYWFTILASYSSTQSIFEIVSLARH